MPPAVRVQLVNDLADIEYVLLPTFLCAILLMLDLTNICLSSVFIYLLKNILYLFVRLRESGILLLGTGNNPRLLTNNGSTQGSAYLPMPKGPNSLN